MTQTRSDARRSLVTASYAPGSQTRTDACAPRVVSIPMAMFTLAFASTPGASFGNSRPAYRPPPQPQQPPPPQPPLSPAILKLARQPEPPPVALERPPEPKPAPPEVEPRPSPPPGSHRIELIIDSLPHLKLIEPIPVTVEPLGDKVFTATVPNLNITTTGNSVGEVLVSLKEQIETTYDEFLNKATLDNDQKQTMKLLQTYISREARKAKWYLR